MTRGVFGASWIVPLACFSSAVHAEATPAPKEASLFDTFEFGGHVELVYERLRNFDLDGAEGDSLDLLPVELELGLLFTPNDYFTAYLQSQLTRTFVLREEGEEEVRESELLVEEAYMMLTEPRWGVSLQVGRQSFEDRRQWLYDAELDAVRALYRAPSLAIELSASREALFAKDLLNEEEEEESIDNYILHGTYEIGGSLTIGAYGILRDPGGHDRPVFLGVQSFGTLGERLSYWLDAAHVRGQADGADLRGYGFDVLGAYHFDAPLSPHVILGYAFGSGDADPDDDRDGAFRQTGLQGNETEVGGLTPFSYYGETFDPELSNMSILTLGLGARPREGLSADLIYHYYVQDEASEELRDSALDAEPTGESRRLGSEIDLVLGFEEIGDFRVRGFLGYFMPGPAFEGGADNAFFVRIEAQYEF
jgi:alginate production protein